MGLFLLVSLVGTSVGAQGIELTKVGYEWWSQLSYGEQMTYIGGVIGGTYGLAVTYMAENPGLGGPSLFDYAPLGVLNTKLWEVVQMVYREPKLRAVPVAAVVLNYRYWLRYFGR